MRPIIATSLVALSLAVALPAMAQTAKAPAPAPVNNSAYDRAPWWMKENVVTQTGYVFAEVPANRATYSAQFLTVGDTAAEAQNKAIEKTRALSQVLAKLGADKVRITTSFSMRVLYEQYKDKDGNRIENQRADKINGYEVSLNYAIEVRDVSVLERAYALTLAANPTTASSISFYMQPTNEQNTWLYNEAIKDARKRATDAAASAGTSLADVKVIDPTGRVCETDILGRDKIYMGDGYSANDVSANYESRAYAPPPPPAPMMAMAPKEGTVEYLEYQAMKNPFIQNPPLQRIESKACVVYGLK